MEKIMSNKKSYMNKENILSEGFFDKLKKGLSKLLGVANDSRKAKKAWKKVDIALAKSDKSLRDYAETLGLDYDEIKKKVRSY